MRNPFIRRDLATDPERVPLALLAGVAVGAPLSIVVAYAMFGRRPENWAEFRAGFLAPDVLIGAVSVTPPLFLAWCVGIAVFGGPVWRVLHQMGARGAATAVLAGGGVLGVIQIGIGVSPLAAVPFSCVGAVIGWTVWRVAYRMERAG